MVCLTKILNNDVIVNIFSFLDKPYKNVFTQTCINVHESIYDVQKNKNNLAAFYISKTLKLGYLVEIPSWFICSDNTIFTFFNNLFGDIIKGKKMVFRPPTIIEIKNTFNYENIINVGVYHVIKDINKKINAQEMLRCGISSVDLFFRDNSHNQYTYTSCEILDNGVIYINKYEDKNGFQKCDLRTCLDGIQCKNWSQDIDGYEKCDTRIFLNGTKYINWSKNKDGYEKSDLLTYKDGNKYKNWVKDYDKNQSSDLLTCKDGTEYKNWKIDKNGRTSLMTGLLSNNYKSVNMLLEPNHITGSLEVDVNSADHEGNTALHIAAIKGLYVFVEKLLIAGANPNHTNYHDITALLMAAKGAHTKCVKALLPYTQSTLNHSNHYGRTALDFAVENGDVESLRLLLDAGAIVNDRNSDYTPLHTAADRDYHKCLQLLLDTGIECDKLSEDHETALYIAVKNSHIKSVKVL